MKYLLLLAPCVLALLTPLYNHLTPTIGGFPLFYWYLLLLVPVSIAFIYAAYRIDGDRK
jgi:hypothetical protein